MRASIKRAPVLLACAATLAGATGVSGVARADDGLDGYTAAGSAKQEQYESRFQQGVSAEDIGKLSRRLSARPHLVGTPNQRDVVDASVAKLRKWGLDATTETYDVYLSRPNSVSVSMTKPYLRSATLKEKPYPWLQDFDDVVPGYHAYSAAGNVTGDVVYVNYGLPADYAALDELGVSVEGKVVLVRYGGSFRGVKVNLAQQHGATGVLIYSDPADDGFVKGPVYPEGPWRPADSMQRGSVQFLWQYPGDPLTPGAPSVPGTPRLAPEDATDLATIPSNPISYGDAQPMLQALGGPEAPASFQGGLGFTYHVGPGPTEANIDNDIAYEAEPVTNVIATIRGTSKPDEKVVVGGHTDAWTYGTNDNVSGWTAVMEIGRSLGKLLQKGWRPERTIVLAGWDGEEYGLLGSTEHGEDHAADIRKDAVAYINMDIVGGRSFSTGSVPALDAMIRDITKTVPDPSGTSVYDAWRGDDDAEPEPDRLGSGSDYTVFLDHLGAPAMEIGYSSPGGEYHSAYDDTVQMGFLDPGYLGHQAASRSSGVAALRLANADVLPFKYSAYAQAVDAYVAELQDLQAANPAYAQVDLSILREAAAGWGAAATALEARGASLVSGDSPRAKALARVNRALVKQERALITKQGIPGRPWFRHQVYAPGVNTGYASQFLPGIRDALEAGDVATVTTYRDLLLDSLRRATAIATKGAGGRSAVAAARSSARRAFTARSTASLAASARRSEAASAADALRLP